MRRWTAAARWSALLLALSGCGGGDGDGAPAGSFAADLTSPGLDLSGAGGGGGRFTVRSGLFIRVSGDPPPAPVPAPASGNSVSELTGDHVFTGTTILSQAVTGSGSITVNGGDLFLTGSVTTHGGAVTLRTTSGAIHLSGSIDTSGGAVTIDSAASIGLHGTIVTNGVSGGDAGSITIRARDQIIINSAIRFRGGAGPAGGNGGVLTIDAPAPVVLYGTMDGRGGSGTTSGGGRGGTISIGGTTPVLSLTLQEGRFAADGNGSFDLLASGGGIVLAGTFSASGGNFKAVCDVVGGDLVVNGTIRVAGGPGSSGGSVDLAAWFDSTGPLAGTGGSITLNPSSLIVADGGDSDGSTAAGKGGTVHLEIPQGTVTMSGSISARGGTAHGSGAGGLGGLIWVVSDANANATGGAVTLATGAVLDASGGDSVAGVGGDAQWSTIPVFQAGQVPIAVLIDSDSVIGGPNPGGLIQNNGTIIARGGSPNGHGGDVEFHGAGPSSREPEPGDIRNEGSGTGGNGVFVAD